jgi:hypothetical protein
MTRLTDPPAFVETLARYECPKCGNNCQCGVPYVPKTVRVAEYDKANPGKSTRQAAAELGLSKSEVGRARSSRVPDGTPDTITGRDGKNYPAAKPRKPKPYIPTQQFADAIHALLPLMSQPSARFAGIVPAGDLQMVANFLVQVSRSGAGSDAAASATAMKAKHAEREAIPISDEEAFAETWSSKND